MKRFHGIYWRQFGLTAGMVLLTLLLLGTSFFTLTYTYMMSEKKDELVDKAKLMAELDTTYNSSYDAAFGSEGLGMQIVARAAASLSDIDFLIWNSRTNTLLTTDASLEGKAITLPKKVSEKVMSGDIYSGITDLGIYDTNKYVAGVPVYSDTVGGGQQIRGMVLAITETQSLTEMWRAFLGIFGMTSITVILIAFVASSVTAMQQTKPIKEMAAATRRFAEGNFDARVQTTGRDDEVEELAEAFNAMADSLQQTERQRREFIANISHEL